MFMCRSSMSDGKEITSRKKRKNNVRRSNSDYFDLYEFTVDSVYQQGQMKLSQRFDMWNVD